MNQSPMPPRKQPMKRGTGLARSALETAVRDAAPVRGLAPSRGRDTGPSRRVRAVVMERDAGCCVRCGISVIGQPHSLHHRKRRSQGGRNSPEVLITLCGSGTTGCHGWVHAHVAESQASGWLVKGSQDPALIPVAMLTESGPVKVWLTADGDTTTKPPIEVAA